VQLAAAPDGAIPVLVGGEILEDRFQRLAVRVSGIFMAVCELPVTPKVAIGRNVSVEHERVVVGMGDVALKLLERRSTRPGLRTDLRTFELTRRVLR